MNPRRSASRRPAKELARVVSRAGLCSRTQASEWIRAGRVRVDGKLERDPLRPVREGDARIEVDGRLLVARTRVYLVLHKPAGCVTTRRDPEGRPTVYDHLPPGLPHLGPVGRLDRDTSGLLLFTNDTAWADAVSAPENELEKVYQARVEKRLEAAQLAALQRGVLLRDGPARALRVRALPARKPGHWIELVLTEGRNRQVRRMLHALGNEVLALERVAIGPLRIEGLAPGCSRELSARELTGFGLRASGADGARAAAPRARVRLRSRRPAAS